MMTFALYKVRVDYVDKNGKERYFYRYYLRCGDVIIRVKADDFKNHNNECLLRNLAILDSNN